MDKERLSRQKGVHITSNKVNSVDGIPIWEFLKNGATIKETSLTNKDFGRFAEIIGKRITWNFDKSGILNEVFPNISIISVNRKNMGVGDIGYVISYKDGNYGDGNNGGNGQYKQKVVIFEVKHGRVWVGKYQFEKYCRILADPKSYFPKAEEVKIVFMMFDDIDTKNKIANYSLKELDIELVHKFLQEEKNKQVNEGENHIFQLDGLSGLNLLEFAKDI